MADRYSQLVNSIQRKWGIIIPFSILFFKTYTFITNLVGKIINRKDGFKKQNYLMIVDKKKVSDFNEHEST